MESSQGISPAEAAVLINQQAGARSRTQDLARPYAVLELWHAVFVAAYITTFTLASSTTLDNATFAQAPLLLLLAEVSLLGGAQQRYAVRARARLGTIIAAALAFAGFAVVIGFAFVGVRIPWWSALIAGGAVLILLGLGPALTLARGTGPLGAPLAAAPLSTPARRVTVMIGLTIGLLVALTPWSTLASIVQLVAMLGLVFLMAARSTPWGLTSVGAEWGRTQWTAFGIATAALFTYVVALAYLGPVAWPISVAVGLVIAGVLGAASFMRSR